MSTIAYIKQIFKCLGRERLRALAALYELIGHKTDGKDSENYLIDKIISQYYSERSSK